MKLSTIRSSIIAKLTDFAPTTDFAIPDAHINHMIFSCAAKLKKDRSFRRRAVEYNKPSEITRMECLAVSVETSECIPGTACNANYILDLTFLPQDMEDDAGLVGAYIQNSMIPISYYPPQMVSQFDYSDVNPSYEWPGYTRIGRRLYFMGGDRDFTKCKILLDVVVGEIDKSGLGANISCTDVNVPAPQDLVTDIEEMVVQMVMRESIEENEDLVKEGKTIKQ